MLVAGITAASAAGRAKEPFCEECGFWCAKEPDVYTVPGGQGAQLIEAIREDRAATIQELRAAPVANDGSALATVTLHVCPQCDQAFATVSQRVQKGKETKQTVLLENLRIAPALAGALRYPPAEAANGPGTLEAPVADD
jgi:hypothetical protein